MPSRLFTFFVALLIYINGIAQQFSPSYVEIAMLNLSEREQVSYINENFYAIYSADFNHSLILTKKAVSLSKKLSLPASEALSQKNYGIVLYLTGNYENALTAYLRSYDLYDSLDNKSGLAQVSNEMGNYYQKQGAFEKALNLWKQAEGLAKEANDLRTLGTSYGMQASYYWVRKDYAKSDPLLLKCHEIRLKENDSVGLGYTYLDLADIERRNGDYTKAIYNFNQSTSIREAINDNQGVLENYKAIGDFYFQIRDFESAVGYYKKAIDSSVIFGYPDLARKAMDSLSSLYSTTQNFEESLFFKKEAEELEDSLFNLERARIISTLQTQYETEKKEAQIQIQKSEIQQKNILLVATIGIISLLVFLFIQFRRHAKLKTEKREEELKRKAREAEITATISSQEKERARYARDLHDGFGQMISALNLNLKSLSDSSQPNERQKVFEASSQVIDDMYDELKNICFDLMPQTLIKSGLENALEEFAGRINQANQIFIELNVFGLEERLKDLQEISLFRITQEWINNILKYSDAERVTLQITKDNEEITLLIEDDGSGFEKSLLTQGKGNGWKNLNTRANLIQGHLELETNPNRKGNTLIVNAPANLSILQQVDQNTMKAV